MKISKISIQHFGSLNKQVFTLPPGGVAVFYGANEAGKSTTVSFISQVLFGFRMLNESSPFFVNYRPLAHVSPMGGSLSLVDQAGAWKLTRLWAKGDASKRGSLTVACNQQPVPKAVFYQRIKEIDYRFYVDNFVFNQDLLGRVESLNQQDFLERIYYLGASQSNELLALRNQLQKEAQSLFKKSGRKPPLNQLLKQTDQQEQELASLSDELAAYQKLAQQADQLRAALKQGQDQAAAEQAELNQLSQLQAELKTWQKYQRLQKDYRPVAFDPQNFAQAENLGQQIKTLQLQIQRLSALPAAAAASADQEACLAEANQVRSWLSRREDLQGQINRSQEQLRQLKALNPGLEAAAALSRDNLETAKEFSQPQAGRLRWQLLTAGFGLGLVLAIVTAGFSKMLPWLFAILGIASGGLALLAKSQQAKQQRLQQHFWQAHHLPAAGLTAALIAALPQYQALQTELKEEEDELAKLNQQLSAFQAKLQLAFPDLKKADPLRQQLLAAERSYQAKAAAGQAAALQKQRRQALQSEAVQAKAKLQAVLVQAGVKSLSSYHQRHQQWLAAKQRAAEIAGLKQTLQDHRAQLARLTAEPGRLSAKMAAVQAAWKKQAEENNELRQQIADLKAKQAQAASSQAKQAAEQDFCVDQAKVLRLSQAYLADLLAGKLIDAGLNYASSQRFPKMLRQAQRFFSLLTGRRYRAIKLGKKLSVVRADGKIRSVAYLSRATAEQLYFALKLAFVQQVSDQINLPVLIDDSFVNFDPERQGLIKELLQTLSQTNQVLVFTAQPGLAKSLTDQPLSFQKEE